MVITIPKINKSQKPRLKTKEIVLDGESYYLTLAKDVDFTATYIANDNEINSEIVNL